MFLGLRTIIYPAPDLDAAKAWWKGVVGVDPYFDEPFYVGFEVGGFELGLSPNADPANGPTTYWGVEDVDASHQALIDKGATPQEPIREVGGGIKVASVREPAGSIVGLIYNPHYKVGVG